MKACLSLMHYMMTWLRPVQWITWLGVALLFAAAIVGLTSLKDVAFGLSIYAFVCLLVIPYLCAWHAFRTLLSSRCLAILPGFRLRLWLALLLMTVLLSVFLPVASLLFAPGVVALRTATGIFLGASLATFLLQRAVASRYAVFIYSLGPFALIYLIAKIWPVVFIALYRQDNVPALLLAGALSWGLALHTLTSRRDFAPPRKAPLHSRDYIWDGRSDLLGVLAGNFKGSVKSAEGTLVSGTPDGFLGRFFLGLNAVCVSPLMGMLVMYLTGLGGPASTSPDALAGMYLSFSLTTCLIGGYFYGETAARSRLIWLRVAGNRTDYWRLLERNLVSGIGLLALIVVPLAGVILMLFDSVTFDPLTYCLVALVGHVLCSYFSLAARLRQWSLFVQLVLAGAATASFVIGSVSNVLPLPVLIALMLGLALLFRQQAMQSFGVVDWHLLRPAYQTTKAKAS